MAAEAPAAKRQRGEAFRPTAGPEAPKVEAEAAGQPRWPGGWHDNLQYHCFFEDVFVHCRTWRTPTVENHSVWVFDHAAGKGVELLCSDEALVQADGPTLDLEASRFRVHDGASGGAIVVKAADGKEELKITFENTHVYSWLPAGQSEDAVIHRPDLVATLVRGGGAPVAGRAYAKRYYGKYGPHWGYNFFQSSALRPAGAPAGTAIEAFLWTADATFGLWEEAEKRGGGKYNYYKLLRADGSLAQGSTEDSYLQYGGATTLVDGKQHRLTAEPLGEWVHDFCGGATNSRMQLRYCRFRLDAGGEVLEGYGLHERCYGAL